MTSVIRVVLLLLATALPTAAQSLPGGNPNTPEQVRFYHTDALGSVRAVTDISGDIVSRSDYLPFGERIPPQKDRSDISGYGEAAETKVQFTGKERDSENGLDYFGARYFSGAQGRFSSVDPGQASSRVRNPQSWNGYSYVFNNPLKYVDPDGKSPKIFTTIIKVAIKGGDLYSSVSGIVDATGTIFSTDASVGVGVRILATGSLISEISGAADVVKGVRAVARIDDAGDAARKVDRVLVVDPKKHPESVRNLEDAGALDRPLPVNRAGAEANRDAALAGVPTKPGFDRDEAPPAMFRKPGDPVTVQHVPCGDNRGCGASLGNQARGVPEGGTVIIRKKRPEELEQ